MEELTQQLSTKNITLKWGVINGLIGIIFFLLLDFIGQSNGPIRWFGLIISFAIVYLAHKSYKDEGDGFMSFGKGLGIGTLVSLIGAVINSLFTFIYVSFINTEYIEQAVEQATIDMENRGNTQAQIDQAIPWIERMTSPTTLLIFGIIGGLFLGFIVSLLVTIFTKNTNPENI
ncbi:MAG: DUF4199 domain-containing protein [Bacteroidota bacterium]